MGCREMFSNRRVFMFDNTLVEVSSCKADIIWIAQITCKRVNHFVKTLCLKRTFHHLLYLQYLNTFLSFTLWLDNDVSLTSKRRQQKFNMFYPMFYPNFLSLNVSKNCFFFVKSIKWNYCSIVACYLFPYLIYFLMITQSVNFFY